MDMPFQTYPAGAPTRKYIYFRVNLYVILKI
jgi:hypothetical protein